MTDGRIGEKEFNWSGGMNPLFLRDEIEMDFCGGLRGNNLRNSSEGWLIILRYIAEGGERIYKAHRAQRKGERDENGGGGKRREEIFLCSQMIVYNPFGSPRIS